MSILPMEPQNNNKRQSNGVQKSCQGRHVLSLASSFSKMTIHYGKALHPSRVLSPLNRNQLRPRKVGNDSSKIPYSDTKNSNSVRLLKYSRLPSNENIANNKCKVPKTTNTPDIKNITNNINLSAEKDVSASQLLHPGWRRVPWKPHFGWTESHEELCKRLQHDLKKGLVFSIYYRTEEEYNVASNAWRQANRNNAFLRGPSVSKVSDVLEVIRKMNGSTPRWVFPGSKLSRWITNSNLSADYDADDEDCTSILSYDL